MAAEKDCQGPGATHFACYCQQRKIEALEREVQRLTHIIDTAQPVGHRCRDEFGHGFYRCGHEEGKTLWRTPRKFDTHSAKIIFIQKLPPEKEKKNDTRRKK